MKAIALGIGVGAAALGAGLAAPALAQASAFVGANLLGQEVPGGKGDDEASANFNGEIDARRGRVCYYLDMDGLDDASGVYIRSSKDDDEPEAAPPAAAPADGAAAPAEGAAAPAAPAAAGSSVALKVPGPGGDEVCVDADKALLAKIAAAPADYYVEIVTPGHPDGAVRGALKK